ncbi:MAG: Uma2 family endonuclease [Planctomycetota bacterium]|nr:Uma2 family endonuclease [Planctomycetota bacterium]
MATDTLLENTISQSISSAEHAVVLHVDWDQYVALRDNPDNRHRRMTFDQGVLEIMTLSALHELISALINDFILAWRVVRNLPCCPSGSLTLRKELLDRGLEGDQSYYIKHESDVRGLENISLDSSPPPDLAIEVDHTSSSVGKMPIYAALQVPEVWRWTSEALKVYRLSDDEYLEVPESRELSGFPIDQLRSALVRRMKQTPQHSSESFGSLCERRSDASSLVRGKHRSLEAI